MSNPKVPFLNLSIQNALHVDKAREGIEQIILSGNLLNGPFLKDFEETFAAQHFGIGAVGVGSGFDSLKLALLALGIGPGDEVIVPAMTFIATWSAIIEIGARPVGVDVLENGLINTNQISNIITDKTKAIIPVHLYGQYVEMQEIMEISKEHNLSVIEDAAQAHGLYEFLTQKKIFSDAVAYSFYPTKNLGSFSDGGIVVSNRKELLSKIRLLGNYGSEKKYHHEILGFNSRLSEFESFFLSLKLKELNNENFERRKIAQKYFGGIENKHISFVSSNMQENVFHLFVLRSIFRDELREHLHRAGVQTLMHYPIPPHLTKALAFLGGESGDFPMAELLSEEMFSIPLWPGMTDEQIEYVICQINSFEGI